MQKKSMISSRVKSNTRKQTEKDNQKTNNDKHTQNKTKKISLIRNNKYNKTHSTHLHHDQLKNTDFENKRC
jgi:hypothetical protein